MVIEKLTAKKGIYFIVVLVIIGYLISILSINLTGRVWCNYDIYSDAILAKYMWQDRTLFPDGWHFGNQIYVVATPAVAGLIYGIVKDAYLALALASCLMTFGIVLSYIWCLKPFVNIKSIIVSLLVVIGGTNIGFTAHGDWNGFQVFYTMASYYACYVIGIFVTLGVCCRLTNYIKVHIVIQISVLLYNFALGMQSLRELLVLNLPLCAVVVFNMILHHNSLKKNLKEKRYSYNFVFLTLIFNICGVFVNKILVQNKVINQTAIISSVSSDIWYNFEESVRAVLECIGFCIPKTSNELLELIVAVFSIIIVFLSLICIFIEYKKNKKIPVLGYIILFFIISLLAVFCAGLFFISVRDIYFFCWYFLEAVSVAMLMEVKWGLHRKVLGFLKGLLIISLIGISILNYDFTFGQSYRWLPGTNELYREIVEQLQEDDIHYLYSDWQTERNKISAVSFDEIQYGTLLFSGNPEDLWLETDWLYHEDWFKEENFEHAYIILSDYALYILESEYSEEYRTTFMDNLEYVYSFPADGEEIHFYLGSDKMYADMIQ